MKFPIHEVADIVGRSPWTIREYVKYGQLGAKRTGTGWRNWIVDLDDTIAVLLAAKERYDTRPTNIPRGPDRKKRKPKTR